MSDSPSRLKRRTSVALATASLVALMSIGAGTAVAATDPWSPPATVTSGTDEAVSTVISPDGTITSTLETFTGIATVSSTDSGATWGPQVLVGSGGDYAFRSNIGVTSSGLLGVTWVEETAGVRAIYVSTSNDQGASWSTPVAIPTVTTDSDDPVIASTSANSFTVVWKESFEKYATTSTDGGATWSPAVVISEFMNSYGAASLVPTGGSNVVVIFQEFDGLASLYSIQSRLSTDGGLTWGSKVGVGPTWSGSLGNGLHVFGVSPTTGAVIAVWTRGLAGNKDGLFAATSTTSGASWGTAIQVSGTVDEVRKFDVQAVSSTSAGIAWYQFDGPNANVAYSSVALGASSASAPKVILSTSAAYFDRLPALATLGDIRVATWLQIEDSPADSGYQVSSSCDAGVTWSAPADLAVGGNIDQNDAVVVQSGGVFTFLWGYTDIAIDWIGARSASEPCVAAAAVTPALAATGSDSLPVTALVAMLLLGLGAGILVVRRKRTV